MKKAILFFGIVFVTSSLVSCTTDDLDQNYNESSVQFEEEMNEGLFQKAGDTIVAPGVTPMATSVAGDPIYKPKQG